MKHPQSNREPKRFILTGTPGSGKTSLIRYLELKGHCVIEEAATDVIAFTQATGVDEPWTDPESFIDRIVQLQKQRQIRANLNQGNLNDNLSNLQFFDRSPFCTQALASWFSCETPDALRKEIERALKEYLYEKQAFFVENLGFCKPSEARRISFEEALRFEKIHRETYRSFGFELISIAPKPIDERADEILLLTSQFTQF